MGGAAPICMKLIVLYGDDRGGALYPGGKAKQQYGLKSFVAGTAVRLMGWSHFKLPMQARDAALYFGVRLEDQVFGAGSPEWLAWIPHLKAKKSQARS